MEPAKLSWRRAAWIAAGLACFLALALLSRAVAVPQPSLPLLVLLSLAVYGGTAAAVLYAAHRWVRPLQLKVALLLALAPLLLTGPATLRGAVYAPLDINFLFEPLTAHRQEAGIVWVQTPVLSDVAFSMIPWQKAVREHIKDGRVPLWNRFVLSGEPLLAVQQSGALHPFTWAGFLLPLAQAWTFQMSARLLLAALCAYLLFRDLGCRETAALVGALGWALSDFLVFYLGYTVGNAVAPFPLLVLGLTRLVRDADRRAAALTVAALVLITVAGHPESLFFAVTGAGLWFLFLLGFAGPGRRARPLRLSLAAGAVTLGLMAVQLAPMAEVLPHTWEQALRALDADKPKSVAPRESASRAANWLVPYAHGESGHGQVDKGYGVPGAYAGAILLPLAACGLFGRERVRWPLLAIGLLGLALWARLALVTDAVAALPLFDIAVLDYFVWLAVFATCALAALGADRLLAGEGRGAFLVAAVLALAGTAAVFFAFEPAMRQLDMPADWLRERLLLALVPLALGILLAGTRRAPARALAVVLAGGLLALVAVPRVLEARGVYPVLSPGALSPRLPFLEAIPLQAPVRMVALGEMFVPNVSALYELEDVRGYESMTLLPLVETFPLWATQGFWSNRVDRLDRPFLSFLNVGYAIVPLGYPPPPGWTLRSRDRNADLLQNTRLLPRAFAPVFIRSEPGAGERLALLASIQDFSRQGVIGSAPGAWHPNGRARVEIASYEAQSMTLEVEAREETVVGTSIPAWPGWKAQLDGAAIEPLSYNHAFLGFRVPRGAHRLTLRYFPDSFALGAAVSLLTLAAALFLLFRPVSP